VESEADLEGLRKQPGEGMEEEKGGFFQRARSLSLSNAAPVAETQALACSSCGGRDDGNINPVRYLIEIVGPWPLDWGKVVGRHATPEGSWVGVEERNEEQRATQVRGCLGGNGVTARTCRFGTLSRPFPTGGGRGLERSAGSRPAPRSRPGPTCTK